MKPCCSGLLAVICSLPVLAQSPDVALHTAADLGQVEAKLIATAKAAPTGFAVSALDEFSNARTLLVVRVHTGPAERHQLWADQMIVEKGTLTVVYGGEMQQEQPGTSPGESTGSGVTGGKEIVLHPGDILHIPAGIPHWVKLNPGVATTYFVIKEK
jgi:mannose-6-phosphate isomerase-like protein (cupin superfamily)